MVHKEFPGKLTIAEDLQNNEFITKRTADGGAGFDLQWDSQFVHPIRKLVCTPFDNDRSINEFVGAAMASYNGDPFQRVIYSESHDEVANGKARVPTEIDSDTPDSWRAKKRSTLAAAIALTTPGVPMLFQGQELLEDEWFRDTDPIDWSLLKTHRGIFEMYRDLIKLRLNVEGFTKGLTGSGFEILYQHEDHNVIVFRRWYNGGVGDDVVVLINLSTDAHEAIPVTLPISGRWQLRFNSDWRGYSEDFGDYSANPIIEVTDSAREQLFNLAQYSLQIFVSTPA
jgi:1,4-alpha-glucan branching enzyme